MTRDEKAALRALRMEIDRFSEYFTMIENRIRMIAKQADDWTFGDAVWSDVTGSTNTCHRMIDKLIKG